LSSRIGYAIAVGILLLSALLRMTDLATLPQGISNDEITNVRLVGNAEQGDIRVFYPSEDGGREGLYHVVVALITTFTGEGTIGYRILSVWLSLLSIAIVYTLTRQLFNPLTAVLAMGLLAVNMNSNLLAREISSDALMIFVMSATMLALVRSLPIYRTNWIITANTISFAMLGVLWGVSFYVHPASLFAVLGSMVFIVYLLFIPRTMSRRRRSYTGFAILVMLIITMPYLISSIRLPELAAGQRILLQYTDGLIRSVVDGVLAIVATGDTNPLHNLPGRPLVDTFSGVFILIGFITCIYKWREPRYMLVLMMGIFALPAVVIVENSPNFSKYGVILPQLMIFFGIGVYIISQLSVFRDLVFQRMAIAGILSLFAFNLLWTWQDMFVNWRSNPDVVTVVNGELGQIAHYLDVTGGDIPTVICNPEWGMSEPSAFFNRTEKMLVMMNRATLDYREADCQHSFIFPNGGAKEQIVLFDHETQETIYPYMQSWMVSGTYVIDDVPRGAIIQLELSQQLADTAGAFITTSPVAYAPEAVGAIAPVSPPIRFGDNLTFLGYEPDIERTYLPGETIDVITYWRVEGLIPKGLTLFTHVLSDPVTLFANRDVISVNPDRLKERDVFIQVTQIQLPETALPIEYFISMGAYGQTIEDRLPTLQNDVPLGDRIFLYSIDVLPLPLPETEDEEGED
jgi:uncharacterized membrane protein